MANGIAYLHVNWLSIGVVYVCYIVFHAAHVYLLFNSIFNAYLSVILITTPLALIASYRRIKSKKKVHLQEIKIT